MPPSNPDFDFGYTPLPPGLLKPTARAKRPSWVRAGIIGLVIAGGAVGVWWFAIRVPEDPGAIKHDPIEDDPQLKRMIVEADREAARQLAVFRSKRDPPGTPRLGDCHLYWAVKKDVLQKKYGIEWRTPGEMNPGVAFD